MYSVVRLFSYDDGLTVENQTLTDEYNKIGRAHV